MASFEVMRAEHAGACYGVQRALDLTAQAAHDHDSVCTLGPLIHNPRVVAELASEGVDVADAPDKATGEAVVIRSHGVVPQVIHELEAHGLAVVNATCPYVMRAQKAAEQLAAEGRIVLVVGEDGHPEVESISAHAQEAGARCVVVDGPADLPAVLDGPVGVVVQTTQTPAKLDAVVQAVRERGVEPAVRDTVCVATQQRQQAAVDLAAHADVMLVLGGRNSSNTTRLAELCAQRCTTHHIEGAEEVDPAWFEGAAIVGVTAGASTPEAHIDELCACLARM